MRKPVLSTHSTPIHIVSISFSLYVIQNLYVLIELLIYDEIYVRKRLLIRFERLKMRCADKIGFLRPGHMYATGPAIINHVSANYTLLDIHKYLQF